MEEEKPIIVDFRQIVDPFDYKCSVIVPFPVAFRDLCAHLCNIYPVSFLKGLKCIFINNRPGYIKFAIVTLDKRIIVDTYSIEHYLDTVRCRLYNTEIEYDVERKIHKMVKVWMEDCANKTIKISDDLFKSYTRFY